MFIKYLKFVLTRLVGPGVDSLILWICSDFIFSSSYIGVNIVSPTISFEFAVAQFSEDKSTVMNGGTMTNPNTGASKFEYQELAPEIARQIYSMKEGDLSTPFTMIDRTKNKEVCAIVRLKTKRESHKANLSDDFQVIRNMLIEKKSSETIDKWIREK